MVLLEKERIVVHQEKGNKNKSQKVVFLKKLCVSRKVARIFYQKKEIDIHFLVFRIYVLLYEICGRKFTRICDCLFGCMP